MKKLILSILLIMLAGLSYAQDPLEYITKFTVGIYPTLYSDSLYDTTLYWDLRDSGEKGKFVFEVYTDSIKGFEGQLDSTFIRYRPGERRTGSTNPYIESDGTVAGWEYLQIYDGGTTFNDYDIGTISLDGRMHLCSIEEGEIPWPGLLIISVQHIDDNGTVNDSGRVIINCYKTKE
jgi:hypothetical protein